jgi:hypothetical protein
LSALREPVRFLVFQATYERHPDLILELMEFLENPPYSGSFCIYAFNGAINRAEKKEIVQTRKKEVRLGTP